MKEEELIDGYGKPVNYINLTNGIQAICDYNLRDWRAIRIQSTACEQKLWNNILNDLSDDFLLNVAIGKNVVVYDYGANKEVPRAVWHGLEWVKYVLYKRWANEEYMPSGRASSMGSYFTQEYSKIDLRTTKRLDYFNKYFAGKICIRSITKSTDKDGDYAWYSDILQQVAHGENEK